MCIAIPREVLSIDGLTAEVAIDGASRTILLTLLSEPVAVGDFVTLHAQRYAVGRMNAAEARIRLNLFAELTEVIQPEKGTAS